MIPINTDALAQLAKNYETLPDIGPNDWKCERCADPVEMGMGFCDPCRIETRMEMGFKSGTDEKWKPYSVDPDVTSSGTIQHNIRRGRKEFTRAMEESLYATVSEYGITYRDICRMAGIGKSVISDAIWRLNTMGHTSITDNHWNALRATPISKLEEIRDARISKTAPTYPASEGDYLLPEDKRIGRTIITDGVIDRIQKKINACGSVSATERRCGVVRNRLHSLLQSYRKQKRCTVKSDLLIKIFSEG